MLTHTLLALACACLVPATDAHAFGLVKVNKDLKQFPLQASELARVSIAAGWIDGEPRHMIFDVDNRLSQPVFCATVDLDLNGRGKEQRTLSPALYVPAGQSRRGRVLEITRKDVRNFNLICTCLRKTEKGPCEHPLAD